MPEKDITRTRVNSNNIPGHLKWRHLTSAKRDVRFPNGILSLLRIITLTDSVISFNTTKRLTNTLETVCKTVSHLYREPVKEIHYQKILYIFGEIYTYTPAQFKDKLNLIISVPEMENRLMVCEKRALAWVRKEYTDMNIPETDSRTVADIDSLIRRDRDFRERDILENMPDHELPVLHREKEQSISQIEITPVEVSATDKDERPEKTQNRKPPTDKALSILERIKQRSEERRRLYIEMEKEKEKEIIKAVHAIFTLCITSNKKSFPVEFIQKKVPIFAYNTVKIEDLLIHPVSKDLLSVKETEDGTQYLLLDLEKYKDKTTHFE